MSVKNIKCVVWDLDNTLWKGTLTEDSEVKIKEETLSIIKELDNRGILQSISSKNDFELAMKKLEEFGVKEYFLYPQINWGAKSENIKRIQKALNFSIDTFAFIDDQAFERDEVNYSIPEVLCIDANYISKILDMKEMNPRFVTEDSKNRRLLYINDMKRNNIEESFEGPKEGFYKSLNMKFTVSLAKEEDLKRVEELTVRTHQLNSTGTIYTYDELRKLINDKDYDVYVAQMDDKYGQYGKIGISVINKEKDCWNIKLLLMSCRVMSKGVGAVMLKYIMKSAQNANVRLYADFIPTDRNRIMYITYKFAGYKEIDKKDNVIRFQADLDKTGDYPEYITVIDGVKR